MPPVVDKEASVLNQNEESRPVNAIDMWAPIPPTKEMMAHAADNFPDQMLGYLRVFWKIEPTQELIAKQMPSFAVADDQIVQGLDEAGISRSLITGFDELGSCGKTFSPNELIAKLAERYPDRFIPFAGIDIFKGMEGVRELEHWVNDRGFKGLSLRPFMIGLPADDRRYYPLYAKCVELDVPLSIHTSANWTTVSENDLGHPRHIDTVAADFPELKLIMSHAGYPWVLEACLLAWKYPNVYLELAAHRPKYFAAPGAGWEPLMRFGQSTIKDKILFGTGTFLLGKAPSELIGEFRSLPVKPDVMEMWLHENAERLLGLDDRA